MAGIRQNVVEIGQVVSPDRYATLAREAVLWDEVRTNYVTVSASYTVTEDDHTIIVDTSGITVTLPDAVDVPGREYRIKNAGGADITIDSAGGTIDGSVSVTVADLASFLVKSDGTNWWVFNGQVAGGVIPAASQFLGYYSVAGRPVANATTYGFWCMVRDSGGTSKEWICHLNSDDSTYVWVLRSTAQF